jgi:hypothetical protein
VREPKPINFDRKLRNDLDDILKILSKIISSAKGKIPGSM